jgi:preprotein translocase subunit YajC
MTFILFLPFIVILYFLFWRPQQQRVRRQQELIRAIDVGDRVVTAGGLIGRVVEVNDDRMRLEVADGVVVELLRLAVSRRLDEAEPGFDDAAADDELEEDYEEEYPEEESGDDEAVAQAGALTEAETEEASKSPPEPVAVEPVAVEPGVVEPAVVEPAVVEPAVVEPAAGTTGAAPKGGAASGSGSGMPNEEAPAPTPGQDSH